MKMHTVGKYLKNFREKQGLEIEDVAKKLFVRVDLIKAIESDNFDFFRSSAIAKGLVKNYARLIGADVNTAIALLRRQLGEPDIKLQKVDTPIKANVLQISPLHIVVGIFGIIILVFLGYLVKSYINSLRYPTLVITQPKTKTVEVSNPKYEIIGTVEPGTILTINSRHVDYDEKTGTFKYEIDLHEGQNVVEVVATRKYDEKKRTIKKYLIVYNVQEKDDQNGNNQDSNSNLQNSESNNQQDVSNILKAVVTVSGGESWIQVIVDNIQKDVGIKPSGYKKSFIAKKQFSIITGRPSITKVTVNGKKIEWQTKEKSIRIDCSLENNVWMCNNTNIQ